MINERKNNQDNKNNFLFINKDLENLMNLMIEPRFLLQENKLSV